MSTALKIAPLKIRLCDSTGKPLEDCECSACCEHLETDCGHCLNCGEDRSEWLGMAAYDRAKDRD